MDPKSNDWSPRKEKEILKHSVLITQSCPALCDPMDCSPPGSSVGGILQARILEWVAISFSRGSSQPRARTWVSCIAGRLFMVSATGKALSVSLKHRESGNVQTEARIGVM